MVEFTVTRDGTTVEDAVYDVAPLVDTANPFGDYAVVKIDDRGGTKFSEYGRGTRIDIEITDEDGTTFDRFTGYVVERRELDQQGADALEVEAYSFDQFLRRNTVTNDQSGSLISEALQDIIQTDTPVSFDASKVDVQDDQELRRTYQGEPVEKVLRDFAFKSGNEEFGVDDELDFFFRPREATHIDRGVDNTQWFNYDIPELGKEAINEVEVWFDDGEESVIVDDGTDKLDLQDNLGLPSPGTQRAELNRPLVTDITDAEDIGRKYLEFRNATLSGTVTTFGLFDAEPGDTIDITIDPRGIDTEFVIAAIEYRWGVDQTILTVVEKRGDVDDILTDLSDSVQRVEMEGANRDAPKNRITTTTARAQIDVTVDADGNTPDGTRFVNDGRRAARDGWKGDGLPSIDTIAFGNDPSGLSRSNTALVDQFDESGVSESFPDATSVKYTASKSFGQTFTFADTGESGDTVDVSSFDSVRVRMSGAGGGDGDSNDVAGVGGTGGFVEARVDTTDIDTLTVHPGEAGSTPSAGVGLYDGGGGGTADSNNESVTSGGGAASTSLIGDGVELLHADGGGGGAAVFNFTTDLAASGGGGARGGEGGDLTGTIDSTATGSDAEGSGTGGDGGDAEVELISESAEDGDDGGVEAVDPRVSIITATTGGGNTGDGEITVASEASEIGLLTASDTLIARATFDSAVDLSGTVSVTLSVSNDDSVSRGVLTTDGQTAVRDTLADNSPTLPNEYAYGSDGTAVSESDSALENELVSVSLEEILIQAADTTSEWDETVPMIGDTVPLSITGDAYGTLQASFTTESRNLTRSGTGFVSNVEFSSDEAEKIDDTGESLSLNFTLDYTIPEADVGVWIRLTTGQPESNGTGPELSLSLNGDTWTPVSSNAGFFALVWRDLANDPAGTSETYSGGDLTPGTYTLTIEGTSSGDGQNIDVVAPLDNRESFFFDDNTATAGERVSGPELFPEQRIQGFETATTRRDVTESNFDLTANDTSGNFYVELANDGSTFTRVNNSETGSVTFASPERDVDTNVSLGRFGSDSTRTPTTGFNGQEISDWNLFANPDAVLRDDIGKTVTRGVVSPGTITGDTVREAGLKSGSVLLTRHELAEFTLLSDQRLASSETTVFTGDE